MQSVDCSAEAATAGAQDDSDVLDPDPYSSEMSSTSGMGNEKWLERAVAQGKFHTRTLAFKAAALEEDLMRQWDDQIVWPATLLLSVCCGFYVLSLLMFNLLMPEEPGEGPIEAFCPGIDWGLQDSRMETPRLVTSIIGIVISAVPIFIIHSRCCKCETVTLVAAIFLSASVYMQYSAVQSKLFEIPGEFTMAFLLGEPTRITAFVLVNSAVQAMRMRSSRCWILPAAQVLMQLVSHITLSPWDSKGVLWETLLFAAAVYFPWRGRRKEEARSRTDYLENRELRSKMNRERLSSKMQAQRVRELGDRLGAMETLAGRITVIKPTAADASKPVEALPIEEDLRVPRPPQCGDPAFGRPALQKGVAACAELAASAAACAEPAASVPNGVLFHHMTGRSADAARIRKMAEQITDSNYSINNYFDDAIVAFPELELFFSAPDSMPAQQATGQLEYQRTVGALFSVYWLLRLDRDGKRGFCFGVTGDWKVRVSDDGVVAKGSSIKKMQSLKMSEVASIKKCPEAMKREAFLHSADWSNMEEMVVSSVCGSDAVLDTERVEAMLCLTAFHDILKMQWLCPQVAEAHAPYKGYAAGDVIQDHDIAIAYLMEHYPELLPSYNILPPRMKQLLLFTQSKMQFNHGWFVQAEAPPGLMLRSLKGCLAAALPGDLPFYFFHWLTDVSGAEGTPKGGAEKLVLRFPEAVLAAFLRSIPFLEHLAWKTETQVAEEYLVARWQGVFPSASLPVGPSRIALLRLAVMAQSEAADVAEAFHGLPAAARELLSEELALTGCADQQYESCPTCGGPAFLIYYGPALLQRCRGIVEMSMGLRILAAVFAASRALWPRSMEEQGSTVVINVGELRSHDIKGIVGSAPLEQRSLWVMAPQNDREASLELLAAGEANILNRRSTPYWVMDLRLEEACVQSIQIDSKEEMRAIGPKSMTRYEEL